MLRAGMEGRSSARTATVSYKDSAADPQRDWPGDIPCLDEDRPGWDAIDRKGFGQPKGPRKGEVETSAEHKQGQGGADCDVEQVMRRGMERPLGGERHSSGDAGSDQAGNAEKDRVEEEDRREDLRIERLHQLCAASGRKARDRACGAHVGDAEVTGEANL